MVLFIYSIIILCVLFIYGIIYGNIYDYYNFKIILL